MNKAETTKTTISINTEQSQPEVLHKEGNFYWNEDRKMLLQLVYTGLAYLIEVSHGHWWSDGVRVGSCTNITQQEFDKLSSELKGKLVLVKDVEIKVTL